jgi:hypothetical protein
LHHGRSAIAGQAKYLLLTARPRPITTLRYQWQGDHFAIGNRSQSRLEKQP